MRPFVIAVLFLFLSAGVNRLQAQSLTNTAWKFYVDGLHDTLTMHIGADTSFCTSSSGEMIVRSIWKQAKDTVKINDLDGAYPCTAGEGVYRYTIDGDWMTFNMVTDPCDQRAGALTAVKFRRTVEMKK